LIVWIYNECVLHSMCITLLHSNTHPFGINKVLFYSILLFYYENKHSLFYSSWMYPTLTSTILMNCNSKNNCILTLYPCYARIGYPLNSDVLLYIQHNPKRPDKPSTDSDIITTWSVAQLRLTQFVRYLDDRRAKQLAPRWRWSMNSRLLRCFFEQMHSSVLPPPPPPPLPPPPAIMPPIQSQVI